MNVQVNVAQQLFAVFFAIFLGTSSNAWLKWRFFNFPLAKFIPLIYSNRVAWRIFGATILLNLIPIGYFAAVLYSLGGNLKADPFNDCWSVLRLSISSIGPAFAAFGFYRVWISIIHAKPHWFYYSDVEVQDKAFGEIDVTVGQNSAGNTTYLDPTIDSLSLKNREWAARPNFWSGVMYIGLALAALAIRLPIQ